MEANKHILWKQSQQENNTDIAHNKMIKIGVLEHLDKT